MRKIGMRKDQGTFTYPGMAGDHPLAEHLLYRLNRVINGKQSLKFCCGRLLSTLPNTTRNMPCL